MLLNVIRNGGDAITIAISVFATLIVLFVAFPIHECAHGVMAKWLGDDTAERSGRLTLNPFTHLDPLGALGMFLFGIGWAKPVPVNPTRCRKVSMKAGMAITAAAGPLSNILLSYVFMIIYKIILFTNVGGNETTVYIALAILYVIKINLFLAVFNLLPIPPFDGSRIFLAFLPTKYYFKIMQYERIIMIAVLALLWTNVLDIPLDIATGWLFNLLDFASGFVNVIFTL